MEYKMTRCVACNKNLNDYESTRKDTYGGYLDMCNKCYGEIKEDVLSVERDDLSPTEDIESELDFSEWTEE
jgi:NAD-dependent SIR2 family protein deacetylase